MEPSNALKLGTVLLHVYHYRMDELIKLVKATLKLLGKR